MSKPSDATSPQHKGLLFTASRITAPDRLPVENLEKWYDNEHIPEILKSGRIHGAGRYLDINKESEWPFLALSEVDDTSFQTSPEFARLREEESGLPGAEKISDQAKFDVRLYSHIQTLESPGARPGKAPFTVVVEVEQSSDISDEEFDRWYRTDHLPMITKCPGCRRGIRYGLEYPAVTGSRVNDSKIQRPLRWLTLYEWETEKLESPELEAANSTEWTKKMFANVQFSLRIFEMKAKFSPPSSITAE